MVYASSILFGSTETHSIGGETYSISMTSCNTNYETCSFWVWKGTSKRYETSEAEKATDISCSGGSYDFATLPLSFYLSSCVPGIEGSAEYTLEEGGGGSGSTECESECTNHAERWCVGNDVYTCVYIDGCWVERMPDRCSALQEQCIDGECVFVYEDKCTTVGERICAGISVYECKYTSNGNKDYVEIDKCVSGEICSNGECVENCVEHYRKTCHNGNVWWQNSCGEIEEIYEYCGSDEKCLSGQCLPDCESHSYKECYNNRPWWYDACGNREEPLAVCDYETEKCEKGECVKKYNDECSVGEIKCLNENEYLECKYMDTYDSYRWHPESKSCGENKKCENGRCVVSIEECPYECCESDSGYIAKSCDEEYNCVGHRCVKPLRCGDGICSNSEDCNSCPTDCGSCTEEELEKENILSAPEEKESEKPSTFQSIIQGFLGLFRNDEGSQEKITGNVVKDESVKKEYSSDFPIIFVHGWKGNPGGLSLYQNKLDEEGIAENKGTIYTRDDGSICADKWEKSVSVSFEYYVSGSNGKGDEGIEVYARRLEGAVDLVKECTGSEKVILIGHSMGGLVSRKYMVDYGSNDVEKLITLATPHYGSNDLNKHGLVREGINFFTYLINRIHGEEDAKQMIPNNDFLRDLNSEDCNIRNKIVSIGSFTAADEYGWAVFPSEVFDGCKGFSRGDGIVPIDSTELYMAEYYQVEGCSHSSGLIIRLVDGLGPSIINPLECKDAYDIVIKELR